MKKIFWNAILILNFYLILYFWFTNSSNLIHGQTTGQFLIALGRLVGLLSAYLILIQLFLVSRFSIIEKEYGFDKLNRLHRWIGFFLGIFLISHPVLLSFGYSKINNISYVNQFFNFVTGWEEVFTATVAFIIIIFTALISIKKIRTKIPYEFWYFAHLPLYIAIFLAFSHQVQTGDMASGGALFYWYLIYVISIGVLVLYRFLRPAYLFFKHHFVIEKIIKEGEGVYSVYISGRNISEYRFQAGQYANLIFLQKKMWFHHPFSYSDSYNSKYLRFTIKSSGDFTSKIEKLKIDSLVWIDGPLGTFTLKQAIKKKFLFIAGGIGITPILSIIKSLPPQSGSILIYSNKNEKNLIFKEELKQSNVKTYFFITKQNQRIDINKINELCQDYSERDVYICGPTQMIKNISENLIRVGVSTNQIHFERFSY
ncbi:MAG: ferric reductase-like transmembrane domain-containing protein [Candidatus Paceibacterota bacterium]|jgi:predicted ferric reductase